MTEWYMIEIVDDRNNYALHIGETEGGITTTLIMFKICFNFSQFPISVKQNYTILKFQLQFISSRLQSISNIRPENSNIKTN